MALARIQRRAVPSCDLTLGPDMIAQCRWNLQISDIKLRTLKCWPSMELQVTTPALISTGQSGVQEGCTLLLPKVSHSLLRINEEQGLESIPFWSLGSISGRATTGGQPRVHICKIISCSLWPQQTCFFQLILFLVSLMGGS